MKTKIKIAAIMLLIVFFAAATLAFGSDTNKLLAQARASTARYHNLNNAGADGLKNKKRSPANSEFFLRFASVGTDNRHFTARAL